MTMDSFQQFNEGKTPYIPTPEEREQIRELRRQHRWSIRRIADHTGIGRHSVDNTIRDMEDDPGVKVKPSIPAKISGDVLQQAIELRRQGYPNHIIGQKLGRSWRTIHRAFERARKQGIEIPPPVQGNAWINHPEFDNYEEFRRSTVVGKPVGKRSGVKGHTIKNKFSDYPFKLKNRDSEFEALEPHLRKLPFEINMLSFPYQYAYEKRLIKMLPNRRFNIFSAERPQQSDKNKIRPYHQAKIFMKALGKSDKYNVFVPIKFRKSAKNKATKRAAKVTGNKYYPLDSPHFSLLGGKDKIGIIDNAVWGQVNHTSWSVVQSEPIPLPGLDLVDLDYVDSWGPERNAEIESLWKRLNRGGIMIMSFATHSQYWERRAKMFAGNRIKKFRADTLKSQQPKAKAYKFNPENSYGINPELGDETQRMVNNIVDHYKHTLKAKPIYANAYKGGDAIKSRTMIRLAFKK